MASQQQQQQESKTIPLKIVVDKQSNKVIFLEATKDFVDTLFSFLSLPLGTIVRLLATINSNNDQQNKPSESSLFLENIKNLYQTVQNLHSDDVWNTTFVKQMLLHPRNPCESLCMKMFLNVDDTEPSNKFFVCDSCNKFTTFQNLHCTCGKPTNQQPRNLDSYGQENSNIAGAQNGPKFLVSDDLKIVPCSSVTYLQLLMELGYSDATQLEEVTHNIGKQEILKLLKYTLTSNEPLTNTILASSSKNKDSLPKQSASTVRLMPCTGNISKINVKVVQSKSQKKVIYAEANGDFVDFIFCFLTMPLGSIVKLLGSNSFAGCVGNLYKSVEDLNPVSVLLNPGIAPQFGCPNQPLNIPQIEHPAYYYGTGTPKRKRGQHSSDFADYNGNRIMMDCSGNTVIEEKIEGGVISKSRESIYFAKSLIALEPRSPNRSKIGVVGFVKREGLYCVGDDLKAKPLSVHSHLSFLKELSLPLDDLEMKLISIGEVEALNFLGAFLTSKLTLTSGLGDLSKLPKISNPFCNRTFKTLPQFQNQKEKTSHPPSSSTSAFGSSQTTSAATSSPFASSFLPSPSSSRGPPSVNFGSSSLLGVISASIFGSATFGSLFGGRAPTTPTNSFGATSASNTASGSSFGASPASSTPFGVPSFGASSSASTPLFGVPSSSSGTPSFGAPAASIPSFGALTASTPSFGTSKASTPLFGSPAAFAPSFGVWF